MNNENTSITTLTGQGDTFPSRYSSPSAGKRRNTMKFAIGDKYNFPTSEGYETVFEGSINKITDKAVEFVSRALKCNSGHSACTIHQVCWLPKSVIEKNYERYDEYWSIHYVIPPFGMDVKPRIKHNFHIKKEKTQ